MNIFEHLSATEKDRLLKFPAYISLLAAGKDDHLDEAEKQEAIRICHIKTFSSGHLLAEFYKEAEKVFEQNITELDTRLPKAKQEREAVIGAELGKIEEILTRLGSPYTSLMHKSMESFKGHVSKAHRNVLEYFVFPVPLKGLTD